MPTILPSGWAPPDIDQLADEASRQLILSQAIDNFDGQYEKLRTVILPPRARTFYPDPLPGRLGPGVVAVQMEPVPEPTGQIVLPAEARGHLMTNCGVVVGVGADVPHERTACPPVVMEVEPGDRVLSLPFDGLRFRRLKIGSWRGRDVRYFGGPVANIAVDEELESDGQGVEFEPYHLTVIAKMAEQINPIGDWILIRRDKPKDAKSGILMSDKTRGLNSLGSWKADIVRSSCQAIKEGYEPGMRCIYHAPLSQVFFDTVHDDWGLEGDPKDYCFIRWQDCYHVFAEAA